MKGENNSLYISNYKTLVANKTAHTVAKDPSYYLQQHQYFTTLVNTMPCAVYILDYATQQYIFVSESDKNITGYSNEEHMKMGQFAFFSECLHPTDAKLFMTQVFVKFIDTAKQMSGNEIKNCRFSLNYRLKRKDGVYIKILQQSVVLETNTEGYPLLSLGLLTDITEHKSDNKMILSVTHFSPKSGFKTVSTNVFTTEEKTLTPRENEMLQHITYGHDTKRIAQLLNISKYTVNAHRRNIYQKTNCKNIAQLINYAITTGVA